MPDPEATIERIFERALAEDDRARRAAFLDGACDGNAELRDRVEALLRAHEGAGDFLARPVLGGAGILDRGPSEGVGTGIGRYKLLQQTPPDDRHARLHEPRAG